MKNFKSTLAMLLCITVLFSAFCFTTAGATEVDSGEAVNSEEVDQSLVDSVTEQTNNPDETADSINEIQDTPTYEEAVRTVLDEYYKNSNEENIEEFTDNLDDRGDTIASNYKEAEEQRQQSEEELGFVSGEILAVTKAGIDDKDIPEIITDSRMNVVCVEDYPDNRKLVKINISYEDTVEKAIDKLEENKCFEFVQKNIAYKTCDIYAEELSDDYYTDQLFYLNAVKAPDAWDFIQGVPHQKVKVGIIDTGAQLDHPELENIINKDLSIRITSDGIYAPLKGDNGSHGTHVSGIVAGEANNKVGVAGVASAVNNDIVDLVEIGSDTGTGSSLSCFVIYKAIIYAIDNNIRVINMSLGGYTDPDNIFQDAIDLAVNSGCVVVCAAGNESSRDYHYPSDCNGAISVISLDTDCKSRAGYSNYGGRYNKISAPGTSIISSVPENSPVFEYSKGYEAYSGTSMATPVITGTAAMMLSVNPKLTNTKIKEILYNTATDLGDKGYDAETGYGIVNVYNAVKTSYETPSDDMPTAIKISPSRITLEKGGSAKLNAEITSKGDYKGVYFHCDDNGIAKINQNGTITGVSSGETIVTACTENTITAKCKVVVKADGSTTLASPTGKDIQTGAYTGAKITWSPVEKADYYQLYATTEINGDYKYIGSTTLTSYSAVLGYGGEEVPASNVTFYKIKAVSDSSNIKDSQMSEPIAYVYIGQNPTLTVDQIYEQGYGKGMFIHWGAITSSYLYRTDNTTNKTVTLEKFPENYLTHFYYDTDLIVGHNYTYELKLFTEYNGREYSEISDEFTFTYLEDDPVDESFPTGDINKVYYNRYNNKIGIDFRVFKDYGVQFVMCSDDNGETWFDGVRALGGSDKYFSTSLTNGTFEDGRTYLIRYKSFVSEMWGTYRTASPYSNTVKVTLPEKLDAPEPNVVYTDGKALINWNGVKNADYYTVYRKDIGTGEWNKINSENKTCYYYDNTVKPGTLYYYKVTATCNNPDVKAYDITNNRNIEVEINPQISDSSKTLTLNTGVHNSYIYSAYIPDIPVQSYTGSMIYPDITVSMGNKELSLGKDYYIEYYNNKEVGSAYCKVVGTNNYKGAKVVPFEIKKDDTSKYYTVTYIDEDGTVIEEQKVKEGDSPDAPMSPYKYGYSFAGWNINPTAVKQNITVKATYSKLQPEYKVSFYDKDNNLISFQSVNVGEGATAPEPPEYAGYTFTGWNKDFSKITRHTQVKALYKANSFSSGDGSKNQPFIISDSYQLDYFAEMVNKDSRYASAYYELSDDIVYNNSGEYDSFGVDTKTNELKNPEHIWTPAGTESMPFKGSINGNGHIIMGLYTYTDITDVGFIGYGENCTITNLGVIKSYFITSKTNIGGLIGTLKTTGFSKLINVFTKECTVTGDTKVGGLIGLIDTKNATEKTKIINCYSSDSTVLSTWGGEVGGLIAILDSTATTFTLHNAYAMNDFYLNSTSGNVQQCSNGGFIGRLLDPDYKDTDIQNCYADAADTMYGNANDEPIEDVFNHTFLLKGLKQVAHTQINNYGEYNLKEYMPVGYGNEESEYVWDYITVPPRFYYEADYHKISFTVDGDCYCQQYYKNGDSITPPIPPQYDYGEALVWQDIPKKMLHFDIDVDTSVATYGDINNDGKINISDVTYLQKALAGLVTLDNKQKVAADYNFDSLIDINDPRDIQKHTVGLS